MKRGHGWRAEGLDVEQTLEQIRKRKKENEKWD